MLFPADVISLDLSCLAGKETEDNWRQRDSLLRKWADALLANAVSPDAVAATLKGHMENVATIMLTPRTQLVLTCSSFLHALFLTVGPLASQMGAEDTLLAALLKTSASVKKLVAAAAVEALKLACIYLSEARVYQHLLSALNDKNSPGLRLRAAQSVGAIYRHKRMANRRESPGEASLLLKLCSDPDGDVRLEAAALLEGVLPEDKRDAVIDKLDVIARKQLWRTIERYRSMPDTEREKPAPPPVATMSGLPKPREIPQVALPPREVVTPTKALLDSLGPFPVTPTPASRTSSTLLMSPRPPAEVVEIIDDGDVTPPRRVSFAAEPMRVVNEASIVETTMREDTSIAREQSPANMDDMVLLSSDTDDSEVILNLQRVHVDQDANQRHDGAFDREGKEEKENTLSPRTNSSTPVKAILPLTSPPAKSSPLAMRTPVRHSAMSPMDIDMALRTPVHQIADNGQQTPVSVRMASPLRVTPKSSSKLPMRLRLGLASGSPYAQQQAESKLAASLALLSPGRSTVVPKTILLEQLRDDLDNFELWQRLCMVPDLDDIVVDFLQEVLGRVKRDSLIACIARVAANYLQQTTVRGGDVLDLLSRLNDLNRLAYMEHCQRALEAATIDVGVLRSFVFSSDLLDAVRATCIVKALQSAEDVSHALRQFKPQILTSLASASIIHRQCAAVCLKAAHARLQSTHLIVQSFGDSVGNAYERRLIETYCTI